MKFETLAVRAGQKPDPSTGAISTPIYQTATYVLDEVGKDKGYDYSRTTTPTRKALEKNLTALEGGKGTTAFSSGLAAIAALMYTLKKGDHVLAADDLYGGTSRMFKQILSNYGIEFDFVDMTNPDITAFLKPNTKMVFIETPTNPMLKMIDIRAVSEITRAKDIPFVVDNTFMTPFFQKPFKFGADTIVHSLTKYLAGHNDVVGGSVTTVDEKLDESLHFMVMATGATLPPFDSWLTLRGIKTLALRMERHNTNAVKIADYLETHPKVTRVIYPGLKSHPQHELAKKQMTGFGGMISFDVEGGFEAAKKVMNSTTLWALAESLGGVESLVTHPVTMTHTSLTKKEREKLDLTDGLIRLSVGVEHADDLIRDLDQALNKV